MISAIMSICDGFARGAGWQGQSVSMHVRAGWPANSDAFDLIRLTRVPSIRPGVRAIAASMSSTIHRGAVDVRRAALISAAASINETGSAGAGAAAWAASPSSPVREDEDEDEDEDEEGVNIGVTLP